MTATSVTGIGGVGSVADSGQKGAKDMWLGTDHLIGPRTMAAGTATIGGGGSVTVHFPTLPGAAGDYVAFANDTNASPAATGVGAPTLSTILITGTAAHVVAWVIVRQTVTTSL